MKLVRHENKRSSDHTRYYRPCHYDGVQLVYSNFDILSAPLRASLNDSFWPHIIVFAGIRLFR